MRPQGMAKVLGLAGQERAVELVKTPQSAHFMDWQRWRIMRMLFSAEGGRRGRAQFPRQSV